VKAVGTFRAFFRLVRIGLKGSGRHAAGLIRLGIEQIRSRLRMALKVRQGRQSA
jgi:hypothetical protein